MQDEVTLRYPDGIGEGTIKNNWADRGFRVVLGSDDSTSKGGFRIIDYTCSGLLRDAFTPQAINRLKKSEGVEIKTSWQSMRLRDIVKMAKGKLREAGITDIIEIESSKSSHDGPLVRSKMIIVGGRMVAEVYKKGWNFYFRTYGNNARGTKEVREILRLFFNEIGIREK